MDGIYQVCGICGGVVADWDIHEQWHAGHGEQVTDGKRPDSDNPLGD